MDAAKRRAYIKQQEGQTFKGTGLTNPSTKRKQSKKSDRLPMKPKTLLEPIVGLKVETKKMVTPVGHGKGKGLMKGPSITEKPPSSSMRTQSTRWKSSRPSLRSTTMRT